MPVEEAKARKYRGTTIQNGNEADRVLSNKFFRNFLNEYKKEMVESMTRASAFDNEARIRAKIAIETIDNIEFNLKMVVDLGRSAQNPDETGATDESSIL